MENGKKLLFSILFWNFIGLLFVIIRSVGLHEVSGIPPFNLLAIAPQLIFAGSLFGFMFWLIDINFEKILPHNSSFSKMILLKSLLYMLVLLTGSISYSFFEWLFQGSDKQLTEVLSEFFTDQIINTLVVYLFFSIVFILYSFFQQLDLMFGKGELLKILTGHYYKPKEVRRIFLFIDLKSSTTYAEKLGHIKYSKLIQDCFADLSDAIVYNNANIYQYVGDEVVLTWSCEDGLRENNCIRSYFNFTERIKNNSDSYIEKYGFLPEFKAGANVGNVTIAEVGKLKKEIAYHGDAINTAARIQYKAGELGKSFVISEKLLNELSLEENFETKQLGHLELKGKKELINLYSVDIKK